jgi:hypothetical protein
MAENGKTNLQEHSNAVPKLLNRQLDLEDGVATHP